MSFGRVLTPRFLNFPPSSAVPVPLFTFTGISKCRRVQSLQRETKTKGGRPLATTFVSESVCARECCAQRSNRRQAAVIWQWATAPSGLFGGHWVSKRPGNDTMFEDMVLGLDVSIQLHAKLSTSVETCTQAANQAARAWAPPVPSPDVSPTTVSFTVRLAGGETSVFWLNEEKLVEVSWTPFSRCADPAASCTLSLMGPSCHP